MALRNTIQRTIIYETILTLQRHATAEEIYKEVKRLHPNISRATVYRNLNVLTEEGKIRRLQFQHGADRFDPLPHPHYHLRCERCGKVIDAEMDYIPSLQEAVGNTHGFTLTNHDVIFNGLCSNCKK